MLLSSSSVDELRCRVPSSRSVVEVRRRIGLSAWISRPDAAGRVEVKRQSADRNKALDAAGGSACCRGCGPGTCAEPRQEASWGRDGLDRAGVTRYELAPGRCRRRVAELGAGRDDLPLIPLVLPRKVVVRG